ncbi:hypothetical protein C8R45DRAFT_1111598 [Mycena sanguinolenta]|nr:hypothetical protein C8R45DRAFT_1111598 [Mycena sanguinolenta]
MPPSSPKQPRLPTHSLNTVTSLAPSFWASTASTSASRFLLRYDRTDFTASSSEWDSIKGEIYRRSTSRPCISNRNSALPPRVFALAPAHTRPTSAVLPSLLTVVRPLATFLFLSCPISSFLLYS